MTAVLLLLAIAVAVLLAHGIARFRSNAAVDRACQQLRNVETTALVARPALPALVADYADRAGATLNAPLTIRLTQKAEFRMRPTDSFAPMEAVQVISTQMPGFVWVARGRMGSPLPAVVVDSYINGEGTLDARLLGFVPLAHVTGRDISRGELMRYLAELVWVPDALLNAPSLSWRELGDRTIEVSANVHHGQAAVRLQFDDVGDIVAIEADNRPRTNGQETLDTAWRGTFSDYKQFGRYRLPSKGEVSWLLDDGPFSYWRGEIVGYTSEDHNYAPVPARVIGKNRNALGTSGDYSISNEAGKLSSIQTIGQNNDR